MGYKPLTREFQACLEILLTMCREMSPAIDGYIERHPLGDLHHAAAEAALWFRNFERDLLRCFLENADPSRGREDCTDYLDDLLSRADDLHALAENLRSHKGDHRLTDALEILAECIRLTTPPLLRWCHGHPPNEADAVLRDKQERFHTLLTNLLAATAA